jgi:hypothetical protein
MVNLFEIPRSCRKCGETGEFRIGHRVCRKCDRKAAKEWRAANLARAKRNIKEWKAANAERVRNDMKEWRAANPERIRKTDKVRWLKKRYGLTPELEDHLLEKQGHRCPNCGRKFSDKVKLHRDHNHVLKHFRGFLCQNCNHMEGNALATGEPIKALRNMIKRFENEELFNGR